MDKNTIIRLGGLLFSLLNLILTECGVNPIPISDEVAYQVISILVTIGFAAWNAWKNNNFTPAAKVGQKIVDAIKSGKLTSEKVDAFLSDSKQAYAYEKSKEN